MKFMKALFFTLLISLILLCQCRLSSHRAKNPDKAKALPIKEKIKICGYYSGKIAKNTAPCPSGYACKDWTNKSGKTFLLKCEKEDTVESAKVEKKMKIKKGLRKD